MKALNRIFIAAIAATAMTACNNELSEQIASNQGGDVKFTMGIEGTSASRVAMEDGSYQASFESTNAVGIFVKEVDSYSNLEYTYNGNAWTGATVNVPADGVYTYYAYYPYAASATSTAIAAEVSADQETGGYLANDYLMANYLTATPGQANVDLQFTHALSLVEVTLSGPNAAEDAVVALSNMTTDATINLETSVVTPGTKKANVTMDKLTTSMKYRAIVPEQTVAQGTSLMTIVSKGRTYKVTYNASDVKFEKGKYISLNVELGSSSSAQDYTVTITSQGITDWGEGTPVTGDATVDEIPLILPLGDELTEVIETFDLTSDAWAKFLNSTNYNDVTKFEIGVDESCNWGKYASLEYTSKYEDANAANSYYKAALSYFHSSPLDVSQTQIYKLSMKIKTELSQSETLDGELSENGASKLVITCRNADDSSSFATSTNQTFSATTVSKTPGNRNWMDFTIYINLAQKSTTVGTVPTTGNDLETKGWKETSASDYAKFDLRFYTNNSASSSIQKVVSKIYISDLVMEPYVAE
ncbi:fimbrillin family protein [Phocaeicola plebeius]|uniref:fimbrillin family protein n=1 Tax=Phocaeicola plebeius TaxID=310297 RepID=UPI00195CFE24|nr:fimbrillin family protein [Phocaeicola plebeius]MBM6964243.1 fimbrillin family protein [Phocaeicola plebeius]